MENTIDIINEMKCLDNNIEYIKTVSIQFHNVEKRMPYRFITYRNALTGLIYKTFVI